ncbi:hypothetical protein IEO21_09232 [Rhodonia placenta]|uniref:Uncharacterized protein n=1 Tax=Rhodonia placenta TaxID=104341 RepID=A0A8H7NUN0_9APHY|nr:hypothetical protein IEO21_09232 [Postia placenta]
MWHGGGAKRLGYENRPFVPSHSWMGQSIYKHAAVTVLQLTNRTHRCVLTSTTVRPFVSIQESLPCPTINNKMSLTTGFPCYFYKTESGVALRLDTPQDFASFLQDIRQNGEPYLRVLRLSDVVCEMLTRQDHNKWLAYFAKVLSGASNLQELRLGHSQNLLLEPSSLSTSITNCRSLKVLELHAGGPLTIAMLPKMTGQLVHVVHQLGLGGIVERVGTELTNLSPILDTNILMSPAPHSVYTHLKGYEQEIDAEALRPSQALIIDDAERLAPEKSDRQEGAIVPRSKNVRSIPTGECLGPAHWHGFLKSPLNILMCRENWGGSRQTTVLSIPMVLFDKSAARRRLAIVTPPSKNIAELLQGCLWSLEPVPLTCHDRPIEAGGSLFQK